MANEKDEITSISEFVASLTPDQEKNLSDSGKIFLESQQHDAVSSIISKEIPAGWGFFNLPKVSNTRAVGVNGGNYGQYWSMIRIKTGTLDDLVRDGLNAAVEEIEEKTNVRFYNSQNDPEYYEPYHIKLPNVFVRNASNNDTDGSGSFGLISGEQYINVPMSLKNQPDSVIKRFFIHALCNAAGMFNEQMRKDRDDFITINWDNIKENCKSLFDKQSKNYTMNGAFDFYSITLASSYSFSKYPSDKSKKTLTRKGGASIALQYHLSPLDIYFLNLHYLPFIARTDNYLELDSRVYYNGKLLTDNERKELQKRLNAQRGLAGEPPIEKRIERQPW